MIALSMIARERGGERGEGGGVSTSIYLNRAAMQSIELAGQNHVNDGLSPALDTSFFLQTQSHNVQTNVATSKTKPKKYQT